jgi:hypothetical protein
MSFNKRNGQRKSRDKCRCRIPELGYYYIVTDAKETEQNYFYGLRNSMPKEMQQKLVIKVVKDSTVNLVERAKTQASLQPQYGEMWIIFDRDQVKNFDEIIRQAEKENISVAWSNPCIEIWFSAYFDDMFSCNDSVSCCNTFSTIFERKTKQKYYKSDVKIYDKLCKYGNERQAIFISKKKLKEQSDLNNMPSKMYPTTTVHLLVEEIKVKIENHTNKKEESF